jgi:hypothetical protein
MRDSRCPAASILNDPPESDRSHPGPPSRFNESGNVDVGHLEQCGRFCKGITRSRRRIQSQGRGGRAVVSKYLPATCDPLSIGYLIPAGLLVRRFLKTGCPAMLRMTAVGHH